MENILEQIVAHKRREVAARKAAQPLQRLFAAPYFSRPVHSFKDSIRDSRRSGIIAEFKRRSPSKGLLNADADVTTVTTGYAVHGASALSVLTDEDFFGGGTHDLRMARSNKDIPLLRKDFIIDEYQVAEARALGADAVLLIASVLSPRAVSRLARCARELQLQVLLEIHERKELDCLCPEIDVVGVNNRSLRTFVTDLQFSIDLYPHLPANMLKISESGIRTAADIEHLREVGFEGFLVGSLFMKQPAPHLAFADFVKTIRR
jgi:indole-3-glycerol phosphate synthase